MGARNQTLGQEIDAWLHQGGQVLTASARAARFLSAEHHQRRRQQGLQAWKTPAITDWNSFVREAWEAMGRDARLLLNAAQEEALWSAAALKTQTTAVVLDAPRRRLAALAAQAHALLCMHEASQLEPGKRRAWLGDAGHFSHWLAEFDEACRSSGGLSAARLPLELLAQLPRSAAPRAPLLLVGFDRILPTQRALLEAWGSWREASSAPACQRTHFYAASDPQSELEACALWCAAKLKANPEARLLVLTQDAALRRGEIERAFHQYVEQDAASARPLFEFSLGAPLGRIALPRAAFLLLRWLQAPLSEQQIDWLLATGYCAASEEESLSLQGYMRLLRRWGLERTHWDLSVWSTARPAAFPVEWQRRLQQTQAALELPSQRRQSPLEWAALAEQLLQQAGWPGWRALTSAEHQALDGWRQALATVGSLGFDGRRISWTEFLGQLEALLEATIFTQQSRQAPIQIVGPHESAGLEADGVWFLGLSEDSWPPSGAVHPFLPLAVQRRSGMPFADPQLDWELAETLLRRLSASTEELCLSYACRKEQSSLRPSKMALQLAGAPQPPPLELRAPAPPPPRTVALEESAPLPFAPGLAPGGASVLTAQSQCPFRAFALTRLGAQSWQSAEPCLTPAQRGQLLHAALHALWSSPPPRGIRSRDDLLSLPNPQAFVRGHVQRALELAPQSVRDTAPPRYLELEEERLCRLIVEWLLYEAARLPFTVAAVEVAKPVTIGGLALNLRLDRIDRLVDHSLLIVDYKTGLATPAAWDPPRPDDVQLPLYAAFGLDPDEEIGGLALAKIRAGQSEFAGRIGDARAILRSDLSAASALVKTPLTAEMLMAWRECIETLAAEFLAGRAEVAPNKPPQLCQRCGLQPLCRIQEQDGGWTDSDASEEEHEE